MNEAEYLSYDAVALAELLRCGEVTAAELQAIAIQRANRIDNDINAFAYIATNEQLNEQIEASADGYFGGVPTLIKDLVDVAGMPTTFGSRACAKNIAEISSSLTRRINSAGLSCIGKSNTSEFGLLPVTNSYLHGETKSPLNIGLNAGGSSGGAAAAVAAGYVPMAHAGDGAGSIRIPAAVCGLFGLKPSRGRYSSFPAADIEGLAASQGVVSRSVRDCAKFLDLTIFNTPGDRWQAPAPATSFSETVARSADIGPLRLGIVNEDFFGFPISPEIKTATASAAERCAGFGHHVEVCQSRLDSSLYSESLRTILEVGTAMRIAVVRCNTEEPLGDEALEPWTLALEKNGIEHGRDRYLQALASTQSVAYEIASVFERFDLLLTPTLNQAPVESSQFDAALPPDQLFRRFIAYAPHLPICNLAGLPAMTIPITNTRNPQPVGVQFIGPIFGEADLLGLAAQLESAGPWDALRNPPSVTPQSP